MVKRITTGKQHKDEKEGLRGKGGQKKKGGGSVFLV